MNEEYNNDYLRKSKTKIKIIDINESLVKIKKANTFKEILKKTELDEHLIRLFSSQPSLKGYKYDIESLLNDLHINKEGLFSIVLEFLSKSTKKENEIRIIASYLFSMQGLTNLLLKSINLDEDKNNKEKLLLDNLLVLGSRLVYEKFPKNYILIRFGEKGSKAYINLSGKVAVLIKKPYKLLLNEFEYLNYLAVLIKYNEYELANIVINDNYKSFPIEILDNINEQTFNKAIIYSESEKNLMKFNSAQLNDNENLYSLYQKSSKVTSYFNLNNKLSEKGNKKKEEKKTNPKFKLNQENKKYKDLSTHRIIYVSELMEKFKLKFINKKTLNKCTVEEYISRLNSIKGFEYNEEDNNKKYINSNNKSYFTIYSYIKVVKLPKGSLFGEMALTNNNSLRNATIITLEECHCGVLNKKTYFNSLKSGAEKNLHDILYFIVELPIFKGIPAGMFFRKYYTSLSKNSIHKSNKIITQGEKPEYIILLKSGQYVISTYDSLYNITNLMIYYIKTNQKIKNKDKIINKIISSLKYTNKLLMNNKEFKNYYFSKNYYKIGEISYPDVIGYNEYLDQNRLYAFSIEPKTLNNDIFLLKNAFYEDIIKKNEIVRKNQEEIFFSKLELLSERIYNMRKSEINSFLYYKTKEDIGITINKEFNGIIDDITKYKRAKKLNIVDCNFLIKEKEKRIIKNETNILESNKITSFSSNKFSKNKMPFFNIKQIQIENNFNNNKNENNFPKINRFLEYKTFESDLPDKSYKNRTITYFNNNSKFKKFTKSKNEKLKIENYLQKNIETKKNNFDGVCLNNMILEDIKDHLKFTFKDDKIIKRNKDKKLKMFLSEKLINSKNKNNNKKDKEKETDNSLSLDNLKTTPLFKPKKDKVEINNKMNFYKRILMLKQSIEPDEINYDDERNKYYKKIISKRLNLFFGKKNNY